MKPSIKQALKQVELEMKKCPEWLLSIYEQNTKIEKEVERRLAGKSMPQR